MSGSSAVALAVAFSTCAPAARLVGLDALDAAVSRGSRTRCVSRSKDSSRQCATSGRNGFSSRLPIDAAIVSAWSWPMASSAACVTASGMTGLTLPGMMVDPAWRAGSRISPSPASGPELMQPQVARRS